MLRLGIVPLLLLGCATFPLPGTEPRERRPPDMVIAGALEVGDGTSSDAITNMNYADCMARCRARYDACMSPPFAGVGGPDNRICQANAFPCWSDCRHRYLKMDELP